MVKLKIEHTTAQHFTFSNQKLMSKPACKPGVSYQKVSCCLS